MGDIYMIWGEVSERAFLRRHASTISEGIAKAREASNEHPNCEFQLIYTATGATVAAYKNGVASFWNMTGGDDALLTPE